MGMTVTGVDEGARHLNNIARNLEPVEMMKTFAETTKAMEELHLKTWGDGITDSPETEARTPGHEPLVDTGALKRSMTEADAPGAVRVITPVGFEYGTSITYARFVNSGTSKMGPKPFFHPHQTEAVALPIIRQRILRGAGNLHSGGGD